MNNFCSNCGNEILADSKYCSSCGKKVTSVAPEKKEIIIMGYQEKFAFNPRVKIYKDNEYVGSVKGNERYNAGIIDKDCLFEFKATFRSASIMVAAEKPQNIQLSFDRLTGQLLAVAADNNYYVQNELRKKDGKNVAIIVVIILVLIIISLKGF